MQISELLLPIILLLSLSAVVFGLEENLTTTTNPTTYPTVLSDRSTSGLDYDAAVLISGIEALTKPGTPQYEALKWLMHDDPLQVTVALEDYAPGLASVSYDHFEQRFALTVVIFSLAKSDDKGRGGRYLETVADLLPSGIGECNLKKYIKCNGRGQIVSINFRNLGLTGSIPDEIGMFSKSLRTLDLAENELSGTIPDRLYDLTLLKGLYLKSNQLTGTISPKIGNLSALQNFYAGQNKFEGGVTQGYDGCRKLRNLSLYKNQFTGPLPDWQKLPSLHMLDVGFNRLTGNLPESLATHHFLRMLYLNNNAFTGIIPKSYTSMGNKKLMQFHLNDNLLTGAFPRNWKRGTTEKNLLSIRVEGNNLTVKVNSRVCELDVMIEGELVEFGANCNICSCRICKPYCSSD